LKSGSDEEQFHNDMIKENLIELWFIFVIVFEWREIGCLWLKVVLNTINPNPQYTFVDTDNWSNVKYSTSIPKLVNSR
jgi:hypothetical protein